MPTVAELGRLLGRQSLVKEASTALVRRIAQGLLSPKSIQRAAQAMPEGSFRFVKNLGRGQFSLADKVVGNVGGHAGEMVRKVATHADLAPNQEYGPLKKLIVGYNAAYSKRSGGNPIAPYVDVNPRLRFRYHWFSSQPAGSELYELLPPTHRSGDPDPQRTVLRARHAGQSQRAGS